MNDLVGRVAVVTGAASGLGRALCQGLASKGMRIVCADIEPEGLAETAATLEDPLVGVVDVSLRRDVERLADQTFAEMGQVDLLFNNAGVFQAGLSWERSTEDWEWVLGVNVHGIINGIAAFVPRMIEQNTVGHVVNTVSVAAFVSAPAVGPYTVSKAAAFSLTECLAHDLRSVGSHIGASVLTPSAFDTGIAHTAGVRPARFGEDSDQASQAMNDVLAGITGAGLAPEEVVEPVLRGIAAGDFLIPTRPSYLAQLEGRFEALRDRRLPEVPAVD